MTSNISITNIDDTFPVAGRDNDSQGFRDNFNQIKENFAFAKEEITDMQDNSVRSDETTNFNRNIISGAVLLDNTLKLNTTYATGISSNQILPITGGHVYVVRVEQNLDLTLGSWATDGNFASMQLIITADGSSREVTIRSAGGTTRTDGNVAWNASKLTVTSSTTPTVIEAFTYDNGITVFLRYLGTFV